MVGDKKYVRKDSGGWDIYEDPKGDQWRLTSDTVHPWELDTTLEARDPHKYLTLHPEEIPRWEADTGGKFVPDPPTNPPKSQ
jgi:hypothetical protein